MLIRNKPFIKKDEKSSGMSDLDANEVIKMFLEEGVNSCQKHMKLQSHVKKVAECPLCHVMMYRGTPGTRQKFNEHVAYQCNPNLDR